MKNIFLVASLMLFGQQLFAATLSCDWSSSFNGTAKKTGSVSVNIDEHFNPGNLTDNYWNSRTMPIKPIILFSDPGYNIAIFIMGEKAEMFADLCQANLLTERNFPDSEGVRPGFYLTGFQCSDELQIKSGGSLAFREVRYGPLSKSFPGRANVSCIVR